MERLSRGFKSLLLGFGAICGVFFMVALPPGAAAVMGAVVIILVFCGWIIHMQGKRQETLLKLMSKQIDNQVHEREWTNQDRQREREAWSAVLAHIENAVNNGARIEGPKGREMLLLPGPQGETVPARERLKPDEIEAMKTIQQRRKG